MTSAKSLRRFEDVLSLRTFQRDEAEQALAGANRLKAEAAAAQGEGLAALAKAEVEWVNSVRQAFDPSLSRLWAAHLLVARTKLTRLDQEAEMANQGRDEAAQRMGRRLMEEDLAHRQAAEGRRHRTARIERQAMEEAEDAVARRWNR